MSLFTAAELTTQIETWKAALLAVASSQSYTIGDRQLTRANLAEIKDMLSFLENELNTLTLGTSSRMRILDGRCVR